MSEKSTTDSVVVEEVRARAARISARFGNDARKYLEHLKSEQAKHPERVVNQITVVRR